MTAPAAGAADGAAVYVCTGARGEPVISSVAEPGRQCRVPDRAELQAVLARRPAATRPRPSRRNARATQLEQPVYQLTRADGSLSWSSTAPQAQAGARVQRIFTLLIRCFACAPDSPVEWDRIPLDTRSFSAFTIAAAQEHHLDSSLLRAVMHAESNFDPAAISLKGAQGLMQLMPATARELGVDDPFDARQNISGGARYLARLLRQFGGRVDLALGAYNAGPESVRRYRGIPPYAETQAYVSRVLTLQRRYDAKWKNPLPPLDATASVAPPPG